MRSFQRIFGLAFVVLFAAACGEDEQQNNWAPTPVAMPAPAPTQAHVVPAALAPGFYQLRPDLRLCMWPYCGGDFVRLVNRTQTQCANGAFAPECYVAQLELDELGMSPQETDQFYGALERTIAFGAIQPRVSDPDRPMVTYHVLNLAAGFIGASVGTGGGEGFIVREHGGVIMARALNETTDVRFAAVDFAQLHVKATEIMRAQQLMAQGGLVVTGQVLYPQACEYPKLVLTQIYFPVGSLGTAGL